MQMINLPCLTRHCFDCLTFTKLQYGSLDFNSSHMLLSSPCSPGEFGKLEANHDPRIQYQNSDIRESIRVF